MRRAIGVSTHAINPDDLRAALNSLRPLNLPAVELSALQVLDPEPLREALDSLDLSAYTHVSFHAPKSFDRYSQEDVASLFGLLTARRWLVVAHPDVVLGRVEVWRELGDCLCIENMDKRKPSGRTTDELDAVYAHFPQASFCFDIGHARQVDPTMTEAALMLRRFRDRIKRVHLSEVNSLSRHEGITFTALNSFRKVAHLIPTDVPVILETPVPVGKIEAQIRLAEQALLSADPDCAHWRTLNGSATGAIHSVPDVSVRS